MIQISMYDANDFVESVILDGNTYKLHFGWNPYSRSWTMDVRNEKSEDLVRGISVVPNFPLLHQHRRIILPAGEIMAVVVNPESRESQQIGRKDFLNGRFSLVYIPKVELDEILSASVGGV